MLSVARRVCHRLIGVGHLAVIVVALAACSSSPDTGQMPSRPENGVGGMAIDRSDPRIVTQGWLRALAANDYELACKYLDPHDRSFVAGESGCVRTMAASATYLGPKTLDLLKTVEVERAYVVQDRASVVDKQMKSNGNTVDLPIDIRLIRINGSWYLDSFK